MDARIHRENLKELKKDKTFWRLIAVCLVAGNVMLVYFLFGKDTKVVISPPSVKHDFSISKYSAEPKYFQEMGLFFAILIGNLSDDNADFVMKVMKRHMTRKLQNSIKTAIFDQITAIKDNNMETVFEPYDVKPLGTNQIAIYGIRKTYMNDEITEKVEMKYAFTFKIQDWFLYITDFDTDIVQ